MFIEMGMSEKDCSEVGITPEAKQILLQWHVADKSAAGDSDSAQPEPEPDPFAFLCGDADSDEEATYESARVKYEGMTMSQLKKMCKDSWLDEDGDKDDLVERLVDYDKPPGGWGKRRSPTKQSPRRREKRKRKEYDALASEDDELAEWRRKERKLRSKLAKKQAFELRKLCKDRTLNPTGSCEVMIDRIVMNDLPKPPPKEDNPARRALRAKYEKMEVYKLRHYLRADGADQ